ncbi:TPA: hypothetical protein U1D16_000855 [Streptococcus suis]|nr:hypothetical protein [Streptococcus suis]
MEPKLNGRIVENIVQNQTNENEIEQIFLKLLIRISIGEMERAGIEYSSIKGRTLILEREAEELLAKIYRDLELDTILGSINLMELSNSEIAKIVTFFEEELDRKIQLYCHCYSKERIVLTLLQFSSVISRLSFEAYEDTTEISQEQPEWQKLISLWQSFHRDPDMDNRGMIGGLKSSLEVAINEILLSDLEFGRNEGLIPDLEQLLILCYTKSYIWQVLNIIPILFERRDDLKINAKVGIALPEFIKQGFYKYYSRLKGVKKRILNEYSQNVFSRFQEVFGFQPNIIMQYLLLDDNQRAHKLNEMGVSITPKELLIEDLRLNQGLKRSGAENAVKMFVLNDNQFTRFKAREHFNSSNYRLFRTPLIEIEEYFLIPTSTLLETAMYLPTRILTRENGTNGAYEKLIHLYEFDEFDLPRIMEYLNGWNIGCLVNFQLSQVKELKKEIEEKKITKEFDIVYFYKGNIYIWDLKNWGFESNLMEVRRDIQNIRAYKKKQKKTREFLLKNKSILESYLRYSFNDIVMGILTVYPTAYNDLQTTQDEYVKSVDMFLEMKFN